MNICVYGASSRKLDRRYLDAGEALGALLAEKGDTVIFGGGAHGLMGAVSRGAHEAGGKVISVAPSFFNVDGVLYEHCDEYIYTETMRERKQTMENLADAFIVTPGGIGTFEEFFEILTLRQLQRHKKPIAILNTDGYYDAMMQFLQNAIDNSFMSKNNLNLFFISDNINEVVRFIEHPTTVEDDIEKLRNIL
ncbi:MAG: TIGR00730 family Rossman fold protein [Ruminococcus sp.]|nr:TIGR00730 family Rossman fold protein [Ruminococcus sp.]